MQRSGYGPDGIYRSPRPSLELPQTPNLSLVSFLFTNVSSFPNRTALIDADSSQTLSFSQLKTQVAKLAHAFLHLGINKNDVVFLLSPQQHPIPYMLPRRHLHRSNRHHRESSLHRRGTFQTIQ
ncbi:unnamed protein product [Lathyrus sativus]|nr:unnamed protein product [Lathyrus sativus]